MADDQRPPDQAVIVDRGYRHYEGERTGRRGAMSAIIKEGFRRVLGFRRKARFKVFPWFLVALALASVVILVSVAWVGSGLDGNETVDDLIPRYAGYFDFISVVALLFAAYAGPQLLVPDRVHGVLNVYFSRPLTVTDYLVAKVAAYATVIYSFWLVPQILLHLGFAALSPDGFFVYMRETTDVLWKVPLAATVYFGLQAALIFLAASFIDRIGAASSAFLAGLLGLNLVAVFFNEATTAPGARWATLVALEQHPRYIRDWIFGRSSEVVIPAQAGFGPEASLAVIIGVVAVSVGLVWRRYRRLA